MSNIVALITAPSAEKGAQIARALVEERLAACVNIVSGVRSVYRWEGEVEDEPEVLLIAKTREDLFDELEKRVRTLHPYSVPEVIAMPIIKGSEAYFAWLEKETT